MFASMSLLNRTHTHYLAAAHAHTAHTSHMHPHATYAEPDRTTTTTTSTTVAPPQPQRCRDDEWQCSNGLCIQHNFFCDGTVDCADSSDERAGCRPLVGKY